MNLYLVVSETLTTVVWEDWFNYVGHEEPYCIAELVVARNRSQARWLAWRSDDDSFTGDARDMPRMSCKVKQKKLDLEPGIVSSTPRFQEYW